MKFATLCKTLLLAVFFGLYILPIQAKSPVFVPITPSEVYWEGRTLYTESNQVKFDFKLIHEKIDRVTIRNEATNNDRVLSSSFDRYEGTIFLIEGINDLSIWATGEKGKFKKHIRVFYNPFLGDTSRVVRANQPACHLQLAGTYKLSPRNGSDDIIIDRTDRKPFNIRFLLPCCEDTELGVTVEDPRNQFVSANRLGENLFEFPARLSDYNNVFTIRSTCGGQAIDERRIVVRVRDELNTRLDTAIIFAVSNHNKEAKQLGWTDLKYSLADAQALKWTLENKFGFKAKIVENPSWEEINTTMMSLQRRSWGSLDQLFVFFSGHGFRGKDGTGYLIPSNPSKSIKSYYKMEDLRQQIDAIACNNIVLSIDACFASTFLERGAKDVRVSSQKQVHNLLSSDLPFRYFIGSAPSNREVPETGVTLKEVKQADGKYRFQRKKFKVSKFMMAFLEAIQFGEARYDGGPIPIWYVGRKVEEIYRPKNLLSGQHMYARATRFGSQNDRGFHFISPKQKDIYR